MPAPGDRVPLVGAGDPLDEGEGPFERAESGHDLGGLRAFVGLRQPPEGGDRRQERFEQLPVLLEPDFRDPLARRRGLPPLPAGRVPIVAASSSSAERHPTLSGVGILT